MPTPDGHAGHGDSHGGYPIDGCENRVEFSSVQSAATEPPGEVDTISTETETIAKIREIICMDAMEWLAQSDSLPSVMTSMPDMTESTQHMQWGGPEAYKAWCVWNSWQDILIIKAAESEQHHSFHYLSACWDTRLSGSLLSSSTGDSAQVVTCMCLTLPPPPPPRFVDTAKMILQKLRPGCAAVFYQSDSILVDDSGYMSQYMDKGFLCSLAAHEVGSPMMWHKIALRNPVCEECLCHTSVCCAAADSAEQCSISSAFLFSGIRQAATFTVMCSWHPF